MKEKVLTFYFNIVKEFDFLIISSSFCHSSYERGIWYKYIVSCVAHPVLLIFPLCSINFNVKIISGYTMPTLLVISFLVLNYWKNKETYYYFQNPSKFYELRAEGRWTILSCASDPAFSVKTQEPRHSELQFSHPPVILVRSQTSFCFNMMGILCPPAWPL